MTISPCKNKCDRIKIQKFIGRKAAELLYNGFVGCAVCEVVLHKQHLVNKNKCPCCKNVVRFKPRRPTVSKINKPLELIVPVGISM